MPDFSLGDEVFDGARHIFDRHIRIDAMLIQQIDRLHAYPPERGFGDLLDVFRPAVKATRSVGIGLKPEFGRYHYLSAKG